MWGIAHAFPLPNRVRGHASPRCSSCCPPQVCLAHADGELAVVGYGSARALATCRTAHFAAALLSLRMPGGAAEGGAGAYQRLAYLGDAQTVHVRDLATGADSVVIRHGSRTDWLVRSRALSTSSAWQVGKH